MISYRERVKCADLRSFFSPNDSHCSGEESSRGDCSPTSAESKHMDSPLRFSLNPCLSPRDVPLSRIRETSRAAYQKLVEGGAAETQLKRIFEALVTHPAGLTNNEIEKLTGIRINAVCGRMAELRKIELSDDDLLVESVCLRESESGVQNMVWRVNPSWRSPNRRLVR